MHLFHRKHFCSDRIAHHPSSSIERAKTEIDSEGESRGTRYWRRTPVKMKPSNHQIISFLVTGDVVLYFELGDASYTASRRLQSAVLPYY